MCATTRVSSDDAMMTEVSWWSLSAKPVVRHERSMNVPCDSVVMADATYADDEAVCLTLDVGLICALVMTRLMWWSRMMTCAGAPSLGRSSPTDAALLRDIGMPIVASTVKVRRLGHAKQVLDRESTILSALLEPWSKQPSEWSITVSAS